MIEFCTKKRMAAASIFLIVVSVILLVIENNMSIGHGMKDISNNSENQSKECWQESTVEHVEECGPCSAFELNSLQVCQKTGYRETVKCIWDNGKSKTVYKSCPKLSWLEERNFWMFETITAVIGMGTYSIVHLRQKALDKMLFDKVNKQIAAGV